MPGTPDFMGPPQNENQSWQPVFLQGPLPDENLNVSYEPPCSLTHVTTEPLSAQDWLDWASAFG